MDYNNLILFIFESTIILYDDDIMVTDNLVEHLNGFIYEKYKQHKELFSLIYDMDLLENFYKEHYEILSMQDVFNALRICVNEEKYADLVEEVGQETDRKINELALLFVSYVEELSSLYYRESVGFQKIYQ